MGHTNHYLAIEGEAKDWEEAITLCGQAIARCWICRRNIYESVY